VKKLNHPTLLREEQTSQSCTCRAIQLLPGKNNNRSDYLAQTGSELSEVPIATFPVDRRNLILLTRQSSGEITLELPLVTDGPSDQGKQERTNLQLTPLKLPNKRDSTIPHIAQNTNLDKSQGQ
jgi:hypothetical protein